MRVMVVGEEVGQKAGNDGICLGMKVVVLLSRGHQ